jgi:hypothetical protein
MIIKTAKTSLAVGTSIYAQGDALGTKVSFDVPDEGIIVGFVLTDADDEASVTVNVWIFESEPTGIAANAAFALTDADLELVQGVVLLDTDFDAINGIVKYEQHTVPYRTDGGLLWVQCELEGSATPTFANTDNVKLQLVIST